MECASPQLIKALDVVDATWRVFVGHEVTVTSVCDGVHMNGSKHYVGDAADLRVWDLTAIQRHRMPARLREALGPDWDVVDEKDHIHIEYDPEVGDD